MSELTPIAQALTRQQLEAFAAGLWYLASVDGIEDRERSLIADFLAEARASDLLDRLPTLRYDPAKAASLFEPWLRATFVRVAAVLVRGDGEVSLNEMQAIDRIARAFGVPTPVDELGVGKRHMLTRAQLETFAAGLWHVASADAVEEREREMIGAFLAKAGAPELLEELPRLRFEPKAAAGIFGDLMRSTFMSVAAALVRGDGKASLRELSSLDAIAKAFGVRVPLEELGLEGAPAR
jgi:hypothetical protein